jgi:hypothetical protein
MKRTSIGVLAIFSVIAGLTQATEFEPIGIRAAARQLGIGFGQGYHGRPDLPNLRPHWNMVNRRQRWPIVTPAPYPATPFAPTTHGAFSGGGYGSSFQPIPGEQYFYPEPKNVSNSVHYHDGSTMSADALPMSHGSVAPDNQQGSGTRELPKQQSKAWPDAPAVEIDEDDQPAEEMPDGESVWQTPMDKAPQASQTERSDEFIPLETEPGEDILNQLEGFFGDKERANQLSPPATTTKQPVAPADTDVSQADDDFHFDVLNPEGDLGNDDFLPMPETSEHPSTASLADAPRPTTPRVASLPKPVVRPQDEPVLTSDNIRPKTKDRINPLRRLPARRPYGNSNVWW